MDGGCDAETVTCLESPGEFCGRENTVVEPKPLDLQLSQFATLILEFLFGEDQIILPTYFYLYQLIIGQLGLESYACILTQE